MFSTCCWVWNGHEIRETWGGVVCSLLCYRGFERGSLPFSLPDHKQLRLSDVPHLASQQRRYLLCPQPGTGTGHSGAGVTPDWGSPRRDVAELAQHCRERRTTWAPSLAVGLALQCTVRMRLSEQPEPLCVRWLWAVDHGLQWRRCGFLPSPRTRMFYCLEFGEPWSAATSPAPLDCRCLWGKRSGKPEMKWRL